MKKFKTFLLERTANTVLADINEIMTGYFLYNEKWFDKNAKEQYEKRIAQASEAEVDDAIGKAKAMAKEFLKWAVSNGYSNKVIGVWWTARPGSMSSAVGEPVDQKKNPTDILIRFSSGPANGFLGLSAKATKTKGDIGFKNPGIGTLDKSLNLKLAQEYKDLVQKTINDYELPKSTKDRKKYLRLPENSDLRSTIDKVGADMMKDFRDKLLTRISKMSNEERLQYLLSDWMDAEILYPPYIKVTGQGRKEPYKAAVSDPINNKKLSALRKSEIKFAALGNESISVSAGSTRIMKIRFKFESQKMASSLKLSGDPW